MQLVIGSERSWRVSFGGYVGVTVGIAAVAKAGTWGPKKQQSMVVRLTSPSVADMDILTDDRLNAVASWAVEWRQACNHVV